MFTSKIAEGYEKVAILCSRLSKKELAFPQLVQTVTE
jgi:hypothetical protein